MFTTNQCIVMYEKEFFSWQKQQCIIQNDDSVSPEATTVYRPKQRQCVARSSDSVSPEAVTVCRPKQRQCVVRSSISASSEIVIVGINLFVYPDLHSATSETDIKADFIRL
jgi:hypothetical protein